jgi:hypothetical protein
LPIQFNGLALDCVGYSSKHQAIRAFVRTFSEAWISSRDTEVSVGSALDGFV